MPSKSLGYSQNFHLKKWLAVAVAAEVARFLFVFYNQNFTSAADFYNFCFYFCASDVWGANSGVLAVIH